MLRKAADNQAQNPILSASRMLLLKIQSVFGPNSNHSCTHLLLLNNSHLHYHNHWQILRLLFFCRNIFALKESISSKLHGGHFDFDQPPATESLSDFAPVSPAEVTQLSHSMSNKLSQLNYYPNFFSEVICADTFSFLISHLANISFSQANFRTNFKLALISLLLKKNLVCQNLILPISGPFLILIQLAKFGSDSLLLAFSPTYLFLPVSDLFSLHSANFTLPKLLCSNLQTTSWKISTLGNHHSHCSW